MPDATLPTSEIDYSIADDLMRVLIERVSSYMSVPSDQIEQTLMDTYYFARDAHHGQLRKSGEPYITHPIQAAFLLPHLKPDLTSIQSCILHDVIEETPFDKAEIEKRFGHDVAVICE